PRARRAPARRPAALPPRAGAARAGRPRPRALRPRARAARRAGPLRARVDGARRAAPARPRRRAARRRPARGGSPVNPIAIRRLDHVVLRVRDLEASLRFWRDALGCPVERTIEALGLYQLRAGESLIDLV